MPGGVVMAKKSSLTSDSIKKKEEQISQAEKEREQLEGNLSDLQKIKKRQHRLAEKHGNVPYVAMSTRAL